jgi:hypothetical protein
VSQCDASGNRCVCERGIWYCNAVCATTYATEPTPNSACVRGAACNYPSGVSCACYDLAWTCIGPSGCPGNVPTTGGVCNGLAGVWCDYPSSNPGSHFACLCGRGNDAGTGSTWTCIQSGACPATQPPYDLQVGCSSTALCSYDSTRCTCPQVGYPWVCGIGVFLVTIFPETPAS